MRIDLPIHPLNLLDEIKQLSQEMEESKSAEMRIAAKLIDVYIERIENILMKHVVEESP
jgi:hypothetical protein